jgi:hypothetical protein
VIAASVIPEEVKAVLTGAKTVIWFMVSNGSAIPVFKTTASGG